MAQVAVGGPFDEFDLSDTLGFEPDAFFISSFVNEYVVRFFSGRFAKGQVSVFRPANLVATARRVLGTNPFRTLAA
jgi:hypothetical protein